MARKTKTTVKKERTLPNLPSPTELDYDVRNDLYDAISGQAGNETITSRYQGDGGGHYGFMTIELEDGSKYLVTIEVIGNWDDWCFIGAKMTRPASVEEETEDY